MKDRSWALAVTLTAIAVLGALLLGTRVSAGFDHSGTSTHGLTRAEGMGAGFQAWTGHSPARPAVLFVSAAGNDGNDCSRPALACRTVQRAVELAAPGDVIKVATGVYTDDDVPTVGCVVALTKTLVLRGGYDAAFISPPDPLVNPTTLDAQGMGRVISITGDIAPTLDGFVITGGDASGLGGALVDGQPADAGGGIYVGQASPILVNNVIHGNVASTLTGRQGVGGGIGLFGAPASTLINGNQIFLNTASTGFEGNGGGIWLGESASTVSNNTLYANTGSTAAQGGGGGLYAFESQGIMIQGNLVHDNVGSIAREGVGGGVAVLRSDDIVISGNTVFSNLSSNAGYGKGGGLGLKVVTNLLVSDNHLEDNIASTAEYGRGGGIFLKFADDASLINNTMVDNTASTAGEGRGGGIYLMESSRVTLSASRLQGNTASATQEGLGGGLCVWFCDPCTVNNNLVTDNNATKVGGGLYLRGRPKSPTNLTVRQTSIASNTGVGQGVAVDDDSSLTLVNSIIALHSSASITATENATLTVTYDLFWGNGSDPITGTQPVFGDPLFVDPIGWDYHIQVGSAAIDSGDPATALPPRAKDLDGNPRRVDGDSDGRAVVDMGAYELQPEASTAAHGTSIETQPTPVDLSPLYGYLSFTRPSDLPLVALSDHTNVVFYGHVPNRDLPSEEDLQELRENSLKLVLKLDTEVVEEDFDEAELQRLKSRLDPYIDVVEAIFPIDEPYKPGREKKYTEAELEALIQRVKDIFPEYKIYVNFLHPIYVEGELGYYPGIPENIDIISVDIFLAYPEDMEAIYKERIGRNLALIRERAGSRPVFFVGRGWNAADDPEARPTIHQTEWDYELFQEYELMGLGWYFYDDIDPSGTRYGSLHYPDIVEVHKEIGQQILSDFPGSDCRSHIPIVYRTRAMNVRASGHHIVPTVGERALGQ